MIRRPLALLLLCLMAFASPAAGEDAQAWMRRQEPLHRLQEPERVDALLREVRARFPGFLASLGAIARLRLGTPYLLGCLGEERPPDAKPLFRLDVADCTVFVLTSAALAHGGSVAEAREWMKKLNYHPVGPGQDPVSYANRNHFTFDRLHSSPYFSDLTREVAPPERLKHVDVTLNVKDNGSPLLDIPWRRRVSLYYLPQEHVDRAVLDRLPEVCGVAFVREKNFKLGLDVSHEGLVLDRRQLIEASSVQKVVRSSDLIAFLRGGGKPYFDGVIFFALH